MSANYYVMSAANLLCFVLVVIPCIIDKAESRPLLPLPVPAANEISASSSSTTTPWKWMQMMSSFSSTAAASASAVNDVINGGGYERPSRSPPPAPQSAPPKHQTPWFGREIDSHNSIIMPPPPPPPPSYIPSRPSLDIQ